MHRPPSTGDPGVPAPGDETGEGTGGKSKSRDLYKGYFMRRYLENSSNNQPEMKEEKIKTSGLSKYSKYERLLQDGKLDISIGVGCEESLTEFLPNVIRRIENLGLPRMTARVGNIHVYQKIMAIQGKPVVVTITAFQGRSNKDPSKKFTAMAEKNNDIVIYTGHAKYGSGPDFDDPPDNTENFFINRGYTSSTKPKNREKDPIFLPDYTLVAIIGCRSKDYEAQIRNRIANNENLDLILTNGDIFVHSLPEKIEVLIHGLILGEDILKTVNKMNDEDG